LGLFTRLDPPLQILLQQYQKVGNRGGGERFGRVARPKCWRENIEGRRDYDDDVICLKLIGVMECIRFV
jgi:hypothetical protein